MGVWGVGLYSGDFARDLRSSVKAVSRLPFEADKLLELLCAVEPAAANDAADPDHTVFWLVAADQFAQKGIECTRARERALAIIADGMDLGAMEARGMDAASLEKRRAVLEELRARIAAPVRSGRTRVTLKAPQKLLLDVGEVLAYPCSQGAPINPYAAGKDFAWVKAWRQDGWGAFTVVERGHMFEFLAWYRPLVMSEPTTEEPTMDRLLEPRTWMLRNPGTLTARHLASMKMKSLGRVSRVQEDTQAPDPDRLDRLFPQRMSPLSCTVNDISIANSLGTRYVAAHELHRSKHGFPPAPQIGSLAELMNIA